MPAPANVPDFLELIRKSGLVPATKLDELIARHRTTGAPQTIDQAAASLVRDGQLTFFQAKQLKLGRYKRFTIGAKYRLLELIGAGGMGAVYLCEHTMMKRLVALKVLPVEKLDDHSNLERFYREARAVAALDHPNIVRAYDIDKYEKLHFLVMEYVDGSSLQEIVGRYAMDSKQFDPIRAAHCIAQAAMGMQHAHELGMVHRDIKPANLLLDRSGVIKVLDMGLARFFNKQQDSVTEKYDDKCVLGTADYLAPEQAMSNVVDVRADIYSLGATFYFMLTGQPPFPEGTIAAKLLAHQTQEPPAVDTFRADVPEGVLAVLRKMTAKDPAARYQEPLEVAEALAEWASLPFDAPPLREMPVLCPLVRSLFVPLASERNGSAAPLARVLFGPGRGVFARASGSSNKLRESASDSSTSTSTSASESGVPFPASEAPSKPRYEPDSEVPITGPVSTTRASTSPTTPLTRSKSVSSAMKPAVAIADERVAASTSRRIGLFVAIGLVFALLVTAAAVIAYQMGKESKTADQPPPKQQLSTDDDSNKPTPAASEKPLTPAQASEYEGEVQTVEFKVQSNDGTTHLYLNSEVEFNKATNFAIRIPTNYFGSGTAGKTLRERTRANFEGKIIRTRGKIMRDPGNNSLFIDVRSPKQIIIVP